ncbi:purine nucleoside phosphorylase [Paenibacillus swuensis]|uniref:Purine nucleoside phosphorylase n=1 Tax=Paenibacillus swuensis TaxID=1178515 RepID=A0A172TM38_9BACL|nr:purine-nucleoside phosphorylase [Paenibacillus swuensis]ANE48026.1 purine nucleoside phosphorylase [Paenibacillus swuensis]
MSEQMKKITEAEQYIRERITFLPEVALILGSGLGILDELMEETTVISYGDIPHFPVSTVEGHAGDLIVGKIGGKPVIMMKGRFHLYEGYDVQIVTLPIRVMKALGVKSLLVTNAAGGVNTSFQPGDLMLIEDHINLTSMNPLIGKNESALGVRFPDMSDAYSRRLREVAVRKAAENNIPLQKGVYFGLLGPNYETPAEIRMIRVLGGDAVGMSTVGEVIAARHSGIEVIGISCISNMAAGILDQPLSHHEVMETTEKVKQKFLDFVVSIIPEL